jgi:hypothetical protein
LLYPDNINGAILLLAQHQIKNIWAHSHQSHQMKKIKRE